MKKIWVKVDPWNKKLITTALEGGAHAVVVPPERTGDVKELGLIKTVSENGDIKWDKDVVRVEIHSAQDEERIVQLSRHKKVVVNTTDWSIIPLENLVARTGNILVEVCDMDGAMTAAGILEKGVDGLIIDHPDPLEVKKVLTEITCSDHKVPLVSVEVKRIRPVGMGDRVCVDTCTLMQPGEGMLVGNSSRALFLVHAESLENPYVSARPFRVNAGAVHAYVLGPEGRTRYLSELGAGDRVMALNAQGEVLPLIVGRVKIERRPLLLLEGSGPEGPVSAILQNAETIRLVKPGGEAISIVKLKTSDQVLAHVGGGARHFGHKIEETIIER